MLEPNSLVFVLTAELQGHPQQSYRTGVVNDGQCPSTAYKILKYNTLCPAASLS